MKAKKKHVGTKSQIRAAKEKERHIITSIFLALILFVAVVSAYFVYSFLNQPSNPTINQESSQLKAAIVDQLSLLCPNQTFTETATNTLKQAGYTVDYYSGEKVTVEFYRNLPTHGYRMIIFRVHFAISKEGGPPGALFTSEPYSTAKYVSEQLADQLTKVHYNASGKDQLFFGIHPNFIRSSVNGQLPNSTIIMMGCNGLTYTNMASAFIEKGAKVYIGWDKAVLASHTDLTTSHLLQHFLIEKQTLDRSLQETFNEVGADPTYDSLLIYYPLEVGGQTIDNISSRH